jgi:putative thioredoxin
MTAEAVTDVMDATFQSEVIERSSELPVVVDFWAPWCGPCRVIGPVLEQLATEYDGRVRLVKVNIDENPQVATQYGISSIPAVMAFRDGTPISQFVGAVPEPQARTFFESLVPSEADSAALAATQAAIAGDIDAAKAHYERALAHDPKHRAAAIGLAQVEFNDGDLERAQQLASRWPDDPDAVSILARVQFHSDGAADADREALEARIAADEGDAEAHYALGKLLATQEQWEAALEHLMATVRLDRKLDGDGGRLRLLDVFAVLGNDDPLTQEYRRQLSSVLF